MAGRDYFGQNIWTEYLTDTGRVNTLHALSKWSKEIR